MKFNYNKEPIPFIIVNNTYDPVELERIYRELEYLQPKLLPPDSTSSAYGNDGASLKSNKGVFLDEVYADRNFSDILSLNRKFFNPVVMDCISKCHPAYDLLKSSKLDTTLLSYYETSDYYDSHFDKSVISICTWVFKEPKNFIGGDFIFSDYNITVPVQNNMSIVFFSCFRHEVTEVKLVDSSIKCSGRFTISTFVSH